MLLSAVAMADNRKFVLVIDAGHGGHDAGAVGSFMKEKDINLNTALAFGQFVERNCQDVKVVYTRTKDVFVPLHRRAEIANRNHADVFISIHTNALPAGRIARGVETYTMGMRRADEKLSAAQRENSVITIEEDYEEHYAGYDPNSPESAIMFEFIHDKNMAKSVELAKHVQREVCNAATRPNKGVKQDVFLVLRETSMPACLIELGYISTPDEEQFLSNKANIERLAFGIYNAFVAYKNKNTYNNDNDSYIPDNRPAKAQKDEKKGKKKKDKDAAENRTTDSDNGISAQNDRKTENDVAGKPDNTDGGGSVHAERKSDVQDIEVKQTKPVFKVQFLTGPRVLPDGAAQFKGLKNVSHYKEGGVVKFTVGEFATVAEAARLKNDIKSLFPDAFVIAMKDGKRIDLNKARQETQQ